MTNISITIHPNLNITNSIIFLYKLQKYQQANILFKSDHLEDITLGHRTHQPLNRVFIYSDNSSEENKIEDIDESEDDHQQALERESQIVAPSIMIRNTIRHNNALSTTLNEIIESKNAPSLVMDEQFEDKKQEEQEIQEDDLEFSELLIKGRLTDNQVIVSSHKSSLFNTVLKKESLKTVHPTSINDSSFEEDENERIAELMIKGMSYLQNKNK